MEKLPLMHVGFLIAAILVEAILTIRHQLHEYKIKDTLANLCIGLTTFFMGFLFKGLTFLALTKAHTLALFDFGNSIVIWIIVFLLSDLCHYGIHYLEHKSRFFWAIHSVHHSSESFNLSIAMRSAYPNALYNFFYKLPLCLMGFDVLMVVVIDSLILTYAFFLHIESVKKLGWLEYFFNTPSHHRVHHASDEKYLDKNFGGMLIIWDKLFGTFQVEDEKPVYGLTKPIKTNNPIKIVFHEWIAITKDLFKSKSLKEGLSYTFNHPGWKPEEEKKVPEQKTSSAAKRNCKKCGECSMSCVAHLKKLERSLALN